MQAAQKQPSNRRNFGQWMTLRRGMCLMGLVGLSGLGYLSYTPLAKANQQSSIIKPSVQGQNYHLASSGNATKIDDVTSKPTKIMHSNPRRFATNLPLFSSQYSWFDEAQIAAYSTAVKSSLQTWSIDCAKAVFNSRQVHREWQGWLSQAFQATQTHNALLFLLLNGIKDQRFVDESIIYGKDLIKHAVV